MDEKLKDTIEKLNQEMRRGITVAVVMKFLGEPQYGYALLKSLNDSGVDIGQDTLYPLLRRLEEQNLLDSEWRVDDPRPRRYYRLNQSGIEVLEAMKTGLKDIEKMIRSISNESE